MPMYPLLTQDPVSGDELIVTRLECPTSGVVIEGQFSLGWMGRLTIEQLEFVGHLAKHRGNLQKVAAELDVAYNTARNRMDDIAAVLGEPAERQEPTNRRAILDRLDAGELSFEDAMRLLKESQ